MGCLWCKQGDIVLHQHRPEPTLAPWLYSRCGDVGVWVGLQGVKWGQASRHLSPKISSPFSANCHRQVKGSWEQPSFPLGTWNDNAIVSPISNFPTHCSINGKHRGQCWQPDQHRLLQAWCGINPWIQKFVSSRDLKKIMKPIMKIMKSLPLQLDCSISNNTSHLCLSP